MIHTAVLVLKFLFVGEIDDELDDVSEVDMMRFVRSERLMSNDQLDEVSEVDMMRFVRSERPMSDELDNVSKVGELILNRECY